MLIRNLFDKNIFKTFTNDNNMHGTVFVRYIYATNIYRSTWVQLLRSHWDCKQCRIQYSIQYSSSMNCVRCESDTRSFGVHIDAICVHFDSNVMANTFCLCCWDISPPHPNANNRTHYKNGLENWYRSGPLAVGEWNGVWDSDGISRIHALYVVLTQ